MLDRGSVLVWEWQDESLLWRPYSPQVAHYIEQVLRETPRSSSVSLGEADASLTSYILDLISMNQFRLDTGEPISVVLCIPALKKGSCFQGKDGGGASRCRLDGNDVWKDRCNVLIWGKTAGFNFRHQSTVSALCSSEEVHSN